MGLPQWFDHELSQRTWNTGAQKMIAPEYVGKFRLKTIKQQGGLKGECAFCAIRTRKLAADTFN
jgi:hypothetical protein